MLQNPEDKVQIPKDRPGMKNTSVFVTHSSHEDNVQSHIELESFERPASSNCNVSKNNPQLQNQLFDLTCNSSDDDYAAINELAQATKFGHGQFGPAVVPETQKSFRSKHQDSEDDIYKYKGKRDPKADIAAKIYIETQTKIRVMLIYSQTSVEENDFEYRLVVRESPEIKKLQEITKEPNLSSQMKGLREKDSAAKIEEGIRLHDESARSNRFKTMSDETTTIGGQFQPSHPSSKNHSFKATHIVRDNLVTKQLESSKVDKLFSRKPQTSSKAASGLEKSKGFGSLSSNLRQDGCDKRLTSSIQETLANNSETSCVGVVGSVPEQPSKFPSAQGLSNPGQPETGFGSNLHGGYLVCVNSNHLGQMKQHQPSQDLNAEANPTTGSQVQPTMHQSPSFTALNGQLELNKKLDQGSPKNSNLLESGLKRISLKSGTTGTPQFEKGRELGSDDEYTLGNPTPQFSAEAISKRPKEAKLSQPNLNLSKKLSKTAMVGSTVVTQHTQDEYAFGTSAQRTVTPKVGTSRRMSQNSVKSRTSSNNSSKLHSSTNSTSKKVTSSRLWKKPKDSAALIFKKILAEATSVSKGAHTNGLTLKLMRAVKGPSGLSQIKTVNRSKGSKENSMSLSKSKEVRGGGWTGSQTKTIVKAPSSGVLRPKVGGREQGSGLHTSATENNYLFVKSAVGKSGRLGTETAGQVRRPSGCSGAGKSRSPSMGSVQKTAGSQKKTDGERRFGRTPEALQVAKRVEQLRKLNSTYARDTGSRQQSRSSQMSFNVSGVGVRENQWTKGRTGTGVERSNSQRLKTLVQSKLTTTTAKSRDPPLGNVSKSAGLGLVDSRSRGNSQSKLAGSGHVKPSVKHMFANLLKEVHVDSGEKWTEPPEAHETSNLAERSRSSQVLHPKNNPNKSICQNEPSASLRSMLKQIRREIHSGKREGESREVFGVVRGSKDARVGKPHDHSRAAKPQEHSRARVGKETSALSSPFFRCLQPLKPLSTPN